MIGAIIGDIAGSRWEFNPTNDYQFPLFTERNGYTDDTICTVAVADALLRGVDYGKSMHQWCNRYPHPMGAYGCSFMRWVHSKDPQPYGSYGNGAAMRVSPVGMWYDDLETIRTEAEKTAACTHNHPEGLKGAAAVATAIGMAIQRRKQMPEEDASATAVAIATEVAGKYGYSLDIRKEDVQNRFDETCQGTVPVALWIVRDSHSFEDAIRRAVSLGADADTLGAIVGSIAEHVWGVPEDMREQALSYLPDDMREVVHLFYNR